MFANIELSVRNNAVCCRRLTPSGLQHSLGKQTSRYLPAAYYRVKHMAYDRVAAVPCLCLGCNIPSEGSVHRGNTESNAQISNRGHTQLPSAALSRICRLAWGL